MTDQERRRLYLQTLGLPTEAPPEPPAVGEYRPPQLAGGLPSEVSALSSLDLMDTGLPFDGDVVDSPYDPHADKFTAPPTTGEQQPSRNGKAHARPALRLAGDPIRGRELPTNMSALLAGGLASAPKPTSLCRTDNHALFYAGEVNILFGDPESGKTWIALALIEEAARTRQRCAFVDIDHNGAGAIAARLLEMGVREDYLTDPDVFCLIEPQDRGDLLDTVAFLHEWKPAVVVLDSIGELVPMLGKNSSDPDEFTTVNQEVLKPLAMSGAVVIGIDHLAKSAESRAIGQTGTMAKKRATTGVSLRVVVKEQFTPGQGGKASLTIHKDRHGGVRATSPTGEREPLAGLFVLTQRDDRLFWSLHAPASLPPDELVTGGAPLADIAELDALDPAPQSVDEIKKRLKWGSGRASQALRSWRSSRSYGVPGE